MKTNTFLVFVAAVAAAIHSTNAQIIINGGFESPDTPTYTHISAGQNTIASWVVGLHSVEVGDAVGNGFLVGAAFEGAQYLDLTGTGRGRLTQAFATTPGLLYTLTFAYTDNYFESSTPAAATVRLFDGLGDRLNRTITHTGAVAGDYKWSVFNEQFTALQNTTRLEFTSLTSSPNGHSGGIMLDAVQVIQPAVVPGQSIVAVGGSVTLSLTNTLNVPSTYQWKFNGTSIANATNATLALSSLTLDQSGSYSVTVSNEYEVVTATPGTVQVVDRVTITAQPQSSTVLPGTNITLSVAALSPLPITYQWQFNGTNLMGATNASLSFTNVQFAQDGLYTAVATDALRSVASQPATLTVLVKPVIVQGPITQSVVAGGNVTFSVEITGNPAPFLYQWRQGSTVLTNMVLSDKTAFFTLTNVQSNQAGSYRVVVTNAALTTLTVNATWNLTVLPDMDGDGLPDTWETAHGLDLNNAADALLDGDRDGQNNLAEYRSGTSPTNAASGLKLEGVTHANGQVTVSFNAASNQTYTVEWCAQLEGDAWSKLADLPARSSNHLENVTDTSASDTTRFYRVITPRQP